MAGHYLLIIPNIPEHQYLELGKIPVVDLPLPRLHVHVEVGQVVVKVHGTRTKVPVHSTSYSEKKIKNVEKYFIFKN